MCKKHHSINHFFNLQKIGPLLLCVILSACASIDYISPTKVQNMSPQVLAENHPLKIGFIFVNEYVLHYPEMETVSSVDDASPKNGFDVAIVVSINRGLYVTDTAEAFSSYTHQKLFKLSATSGGNFASIFMRSKLKQEIDHELSPGKRLYKVIVSQRLAYEEKLHPPPDRRSKNQNALSSQNVSAIVKATLAAVYPTTLASHKNKTQFKTSVDTPSYKELKHAKNFAVVVGVEKYPGPIQKAKFAERDAQSVFSHLQALGVPIRHIKRLTNDTATITRIQSALTWLKRNIRPNSTVYFYYSGHGSTDTKGNAYLVPFDGDPSDLPETAFSVTALYQELASLQAKHIIVVLDTSFLGEGKRSVIGNGVRPLVTRIKEGSVPDTGKFVVFTAARSDQESGILNSKGHGLFTYYLLKGLNGGAEHGGHVTVASLYHYIKPKVERKASLDNRTQVPELEPHLSGNVESFQVR